MFTSTMTQPPRQERKGSFFKLIDSFACEIVTLKKEMGKKKVPEEDQMDDALLRLGEEVGGLFYQASPCTGIGVGLVGARDSGYDSLRRRLSVLDRLVQTHGVWLQLGLSHQDATRVLQSQPDGTFVVRKSTSLRRKVISVRMNKDSAVPVKDFPVKESQYTFSLVGSGLSFADLFRLVAFCCISRDVLPFTLKLPEPIASATASADLKEVAKIGACSWDAVAGHSRKDSVPSSGISGPERPSPPPVCLTKSLRRPQIRTRTPSELESCQSNGALCFINPLFIKVHQPDGDHSSTSATAKVGLSGKPISNGPQPENKDTQHICGDGAEVSCSDQRDGSQLGHSELQSLGGKSELPGVNSQTSNHKISDTDRGQRLPPPRPPPPRLAAPLQQRSMPEKIPWINVSKEKEKVEEKGSLFSRLSSSLSISPSSSPPKKNNISSPPSISRPSLHISLSSLSSCPRRLNALPSSSQEDAQCHLALEEQTIERALLMARLSHCNATRNPAQESSKQADGTGDHVEQTGKKCNSGSERLSDMSLSTNSSDSLDFSQSSAFFLPAAHDPSSPTVADFNTHLPLSLLPRHQLCCSTEDDEEDEEDPDYGVGLESDQDQDQDLTMVPPGHRMKRRPSASALILQRALRGHLRKMSGVFNSLLTPEKRAVRRVVELSRDKGSYFGCLVQDYLSYMGEGAGTQAWQGYASGLELLQTLRQFITQMKSYLRQSSELEPPIESLIPEDQIDGVLEKAMHKCVLKTLKPVVSAALQEFQVCSGEWRELKENLSLAKARQPQEMGVADTPPPDPAAIEKIKHKFHTMSKLYSPEKKVTMLLRVCKLIYTIMEDHSGRLYGADDFLPMLTYVLAQCDMPQLDNEILYMMELLDPSLLHGEGGYYLTSAYGAMSLIRNFQEEQAARVLSSETRDTLHQWHRRRTTQRFAPSIDDFQNYLRVALQELDSGCTAKTLQVRPYASVEEVCRLCAQKLKVPDPENYGLFLLMEGSSQQLAADIHPQKIKAELHSRSQSTPFHFVFRRVAGGKPSSSASPELMANLNDFTMISSPQAKLNDLSTDLPAPSTLLNSGLSPSVGLSLPPSHLNGNSISI
ncbi:ras and Rab interactor 2 isoform 2-T4 [Spinachia spinachia]